MKLFKKIFNLKTRVGNHVFWTILLAIIFSVFAIFFTYTWLNAIANSNKKTVSTTEDLLILHKIKASLPTAESAQRGYLLTQNKNYLTSFEASIVLLRQSINHLALSDGLQENPDKKYVTDLTMAIDGRIAEMRLAIGLHEKSSLDEAFDGLSLSKEFVRTDKIHFLEDDFIKYQYEKLQKYRLERSEKVNSAKWLIISTILVLLIVIVISFKTVLREIIEKDKSRVELAKNNQINQEQLIEAAKKVQKIALEAQGDVEREHKKIAGDVDGELGAVLTATKMDLAWVIKKLNDITPDIADKLKKTNSYLERGISFKSQISEELYPSNFTALGIWLLIETFIKRAAQLNQWQLTLNMPQKAVWLNENIAMMLYRVVETALSTTNKHAKLNKIFINITEYDHWLSIEIEYIGICFDEATIKNSNFSLIRMKNRVQAIGGQFEVITNPNKGTTMRVNLPADMMN